MFSMHYHFVFALQLSDISLYTKKTEAQNTMQFAYNNTNPGLSDTKVPAGSLPLHLFFFTEPSNTFLKIKHLRTGNKCNQQA